MRPLLLLTALALLPGAAPPPVPAYREFGRWLVACDNARACVARGFDEGTQAQLELRRAAGEGPVSLALSAADLIDASALRLDGKPLPLPGWSKEAASLSTRDFAAVAAFVTAYRDGHAISLDPAAFGERARTVPLDGFTAALLMVDAVQGRPGTPTALVSSRGNGTAPPAPLLPKAPRWTKPQALSATEAERLRKAARRLNSPTSDACTVSDPPAVYALDASSALAIRPCAMAAYQGSAVVAVLPRAGGATKPVTLALPGVPQEGGGAATDGPDMVDPGFDPATGVLSSAAKGRGLADCGSSASWVWSGGAFRLKELSYQGQCGGVEPGDWPALFRTR